MTRIASLLPSATEIVCALGLGDRLVGVSHACDYPPDVVVKPRLTRPRVNLDGLTSGEVDAAVRQALREFGSVYAVDLDQLSALAPDLVLTQGVCDVCAVPARQAAEAAALLDGVPAVLSLDAHTLDAVRDGILAVGRAAGAIARARALADAIAARLAAVRARRSGRRPRVLALEWLDPPFVPGHWVPELIDLAGGTLVAGTAGRPSRAVAWGDVAGADPDVLLVMPCGFGLDAARAGAAAHAGALRRVAPRAIRAGRAYAVDAAAYFSRPGPRVAEAAELLAALLAGERAIFGACDVFS